MRRILSSCTAVTSKLLPTFPSPSGPLFLFSAARSTSLLKRYMSSAASAILGPAAAAASNPECSHAPVNADGTPLMTDATYIPQQVGVVQRPSAQTAKISRVVFLGTGSAIPSPGRRNTSAIALNLSNASAILLDCGEATQHQIMKSQSVNFNRIGVILITHLHGDHCYGLFGLLSTMAMQGRVEPVVVVGPRGLRNMVVTVLAASGGFASFPLQFLELEPEQSYPDLGVFAGGIRLEAYPLAHRVASFGYVLREGERPGELLVEKARAAGAKGKEFALLKAGQDVELSDGSGRTVRSADCVGAPLRGRSLALLQDTYDSSSTLDACRDVDLLIHECTYSAALRVKAIDHGHSTSAMCGEYAAKVNAKMVVMTHFSNRYDTTEQTKRREATKAAKTSGVSPEQLQSLNIASDASAAGASSRPAPITAVAAVPDVQTLSALVSEAESAFAASHSSGILPPGGIHAAEDFTIIDSVREQFIIAKDKDRIFANDLIAGE